LELGQVEVLVGWFVWFGSLVGWLVRLGAARSGLPRPILFWFFWARFVRAVFVGRRRGVWPLRGAAGGSAGGPLWFRRAPMAAPAGGSASFGVDGLPSPGV